MRLRWSKAIPILLSLAVLGYLITLLALHRLRLPPESEVPRQGMQIAPFMLPTLDGGEVTRDGLLGKPTYLNFWATWCLPCRLEMPKIEELYREQGSWANFIMINVREPPDVVRRFIAENGFTLPVALDDGTLYEKWGLRGLPTSIFLDRYGRVCKVVEGFMGKDYIRWALENAASGC